MYASEYKRIEQLENIHFWYRAMEEYVLDLLGKKVEGKKIRILDAGCGTGGMSVKLEKYGEVTALDINEVALSYAGKKKLKKVVKGTVEKLPFPDKYFDIVISLDVLYHQDVKDDLKALREVYRVLKPGGLLILRLPALEILRGAHDVTVQTRHRYSVQETKDKLLVVGFKIEKLTYANFLLSLPLLVKRSLERFSSRKKLASDTVLLPGVVNELFYQILSNENKLLSYFFLPFGSSVIAVACK